MKAYLRLARVQTAGVTATVPLYGAVAAATSAGADFGGGALSLAVAAPLLAIGFLAHLFGFIHNEIADRSVDAKAATQRRKPLPSGEVSLRDAWAGAYLGLAGGLLVAAALAWFTSQAVFALAVAAAAFAGAYNTRGKAFAGGDILLAISIGCFVLLGAAAVGGVQAMLSPGAVGMAVLAAMVLFFNNAFEGGFKDFESDDLGGKRTLILSLRAQGERYDSPDGLVVIASLAFHGALLAVTSVVVLFALSAGNVAVDLGRGVTALLLVAAMGRFYVRGVAVIDRKQMLTFFAIHEALAVLLLIVVLLAHMAWWFAFALFAGPLAVFATANRALYGTFAAPDV